MKLKHNKKELESIIHDIFQNNGLTNEDLSCDDTYNSIVDTIYETYISINNDPFSHLNTSNESNSLSLSFSGITDSMKEECRQLYSLIHKLLDERTEVIGENYSDEQLAEIKEQLVYLDSIPLPKQRTPEWYEFRNNRLTASDLGTVVGVNPYSSLKDLILKKCGHEKPFHSGSAIIHGVKYEDVAISIYERRNDVHIEEYGCLPHPTIPFFGASPDGICSAKSNSKNYIGRMVEIKCPKSRSLTGFVPEYYAAQVQGQLEVCGLEYCDFLECVLREYKSKEDFIKDTKGGKRGNLNYRKNELEKGALIELYNISEKKAQYMYCPYDMLKNLKNFNKWEEETINNSLLDEKLDYIGTTYWKLDEYSNILVKRDKKWFMEAYIKIEQFWNDVLKYRKDGVQELLPKEKTKKKNKVNTTHTGFLYDSD